MFAFSDLFQWERFITPQIIKIFYWLAVAVSVLAGLSGIGTGLAMMLVNPIAGLISVVISMIGIVIGVIFARIAAEFILIVFRISEHLGAIRQRGEGM
jgi:mannose/fructose/N-acetylgalactosamine-specific phosphotransferase system component IID